MFRKAPLGAISGFLVILVLLGACTPQQTAQIAPAGEGSKPAPASPQKGGTLRVAVSGDAGELDPHKATVGTTRRFARLIYNSLTNSDAAGNIIPELAESWSTPDPRTYVFKLRKGVKFHDGTDFNAEAVKFNFDRILAPETKAFMRGQFVGAGETSVDVVDEYTARFSLKTSNAAFPSFMAEIMAGGIISPAALKKWGDQINVHPVGTGPFEFVEWVKDDHMTVKRFEGYWRKDEKGSPLPYLDQIIFRPIPDSTVRLTDLRTGNVDLVDTVLPSDVATVAADKNLKTVDWGNARFMIMLNCSVPPFNNKALRQAVAWALDGETLHRAIYVGIGAAAQAPLDPKHWAFDPQGKFYAKDLVRAKAKLAEGGKPNGFKFEAKNFNRPLEVRVAQAVKGQLAEAGINMEILLVEERQLGSDRVAAKYEAIFSTGVGMPADPDVELYPSYHSKGARNYAKCGNPDLDQLLDKAQQVPDQAERKTLYAKAQAMILDDSSHIYLHHDALTTAMNQKVQGFIPNIGLYHLQFDWIWLQE